MTDELRRLRREEQRRSARSRDGKRQDIPVKMKQVSDDLLPPRLCMYRGEIIASINKSCPTAKKVHNCHCEDVASGCCVIEPLSETDTEVRGLGNKWKKKLSSLPPIPACLTCEHKRAFSWDGRVCVACPDAGSDVVKELRSWFPGVSVYNSDATGFNAGVNAIAAKAEAEYTVVVHPAVKIDGAFVAGINKSVSFLDSYADASGVGGVIVDRGSVFEIAHDFVVKDGVLFLTKRKRQPVKHDGLSYHICDCICQCGIFRTSFLRKHLLDENLDGIFWEMFYRVRETHQFACLQDMQLEWDRDPSVGFGKKRDAEQRHGVRWGGVLSGNPPQPERPREKSGTAFHVFTHNCSEHEVALLTGEIGDVLQKRGYKALALIVEKKMIEYKVLRRVVVGENFHRSGWPYAMMNLTMRQNPLGDIMLDDFVEQTFLYRGDVAQIAGYREPWAAFFHHPPYAPDWFWNEQKLQKLWDRESFVKSLPSLKVAFALSEHLGSWLRDALNCPVVVLKHPCEIPDKAWGDYEMPDRPRLLSFGWYLRDTQLLKRIPDSEHYTKTWIWPGRKNMEAYNALVVENEGVGEYGTDVIPYVQNDKFDELLGTSVVVCRVFDASATNGVIDCIVRNTPLIINRHPAVVEYLGADYPGFYDDVGEIPDLAMEGSFKCSEYMRAMDKAWCDGNVFASGVIEGINGGMA